MEIEYNVNAFDIWKVQMYKLYTSFAGAINVVFTGSMMFTGLTFIRHERLGIGLLFFVLASWFPLIHPFLVFNHTAQQAKRIQNMKMSISDGGFTISNVLERTTTPFADVVFSGEKLGVFIIQTKNRHSYMIPLKGLGNQEEAFMKFFTVKA